MKDISFEDISLKIGFLKYIPFQGILFRDIFLKYDRMSKEELDRVKNENDGQKISYDD